jgi:hypothetical protein
MKPIHFAVFGTLAVALWLASGCGTEDKKFTYELSENGCSTGSHTFESLEEQCAALKNEDINHGCAYGMRKSHYEQQKCPGTFAG